VKADELKKLIDSGVPILIVDNRSEYEYSRGHLPKAVNIPQERLFSLDNLLPKDKAFPIVFYCTGYG
jgi:rhodanese-related sulfurtransferase